METALQKFKDMEKSWKWYQINRFFWSPCRSGDLFSGNKSVYRAGCSLQRRDHGIFPGAEDASYSVSGFAASEF